MKKDLLYLIRCKSTNKYVGFQLKDGSPQAYKTYTGAMKSILKNSSNPDNYCIDVYHLIHNDLPEECKDMYKEDISLEVK